jgi:hypothetical protein
MRQCALRRKLGNPFAQGHGGVVSQHEGQSCGAAPPHPDPPDLRRALWLQTAGRAPTRRARSILMSMVIRNGRMPPRDSANQRSARRCVNCQSVARISGTGVARFSKSLGGGRSSDPSKPLCWRFEPGPRGRGRRFSWRASASTRPAVPRSCWAFVPDPPNVHRSGYDVTVSSGAPEGIIGCHGVSLLATA